MTYQTVSPIDACHCPTYQPTYLTNACDDGNDCTVDDKCENGTCQGTPVQISFGPNLANGVCAGGSGQISVTITPDSAQGQVTFESADPSVVTVSGGYPTLTVTAMPDSGGKSTTIKAKINGSECSSQGVTVATDTCDDGNPCTVDDHCVNGVCTGTSVQISFSQNPPGAFCVGDSATIGVTISPASAQGLVSFDSDNPAVATVAGGSTGLTVTGVAAGSATIQARISGAVCASTSVTVADCPCDDGNDCTVDDRYHNGVCQGTPVQIFFAPNPLTVAAGDSGAMSVIIMPPSAQGLVIFDTTDPSVATVMSVGGTLFVAGLTPGSTSIRAKSSFENCYY